MSILDLFSEFHVSWRLLQSYAPMLSSVSNCYPACNHMIKGNSQIFTCSISTMETQEIDVKYVQSWHQNNVINVVLVSILSTLNIFLPLLLLTVNSKCLLSLFIESCSHNHLHIVIQFFSFAVFLYIFPLFVADFRWMFLLLNK